MPSAKLDLEGLPQLGYTNLSLGDIVWPIDSRRFRFRSNPHRFISSYKVNWMAPLLTPKRASEVPRNRPAVPSVLQIDDKPSDFIQKTDAD
jgi:hypothetical protein